MPTYDEDAFSSKPKPVQQKVNPNPVPPPMKDIKVDSRLFPRGALLANIEGSQWYPKSYYSQLLMSGNNPISFSLDLPAVSQQYNRIDAPEFRVQEPLTGSYRNGDNEYEVTGSSVIYTGIIPNVHDPFLADIGDGRLGRFEITEVTPKSYLQAAVYEVRYKLNGYATPAEITNLEVKTVSSGRYVRDQYLAGRRGVLIEQEYTQYEEMRKLLATLPNEYFREFFSREFQTFLVPDQKDTVYDSFVVSFFKRMLDVSDHPWLAKVTELNVDVGYDTNIFTLFDAALEGDETIIDRCHQNIKPVNVNYFQSQALFANVSYSGIATAMFPIGIKVSQGAWSSVIMPSFDLFLGPNVTLNRKVSMSEAYSSRTMPDLPGAVDTDSVEWISDEIFKDSYVFSKAFYENLDSQSGIEYMFRSAVNGTFADADKIIKACKDRVLWTSTTRFYYVPILLFILRTALVNVS